MGALMGAWVIGRWMIPAQAPPPPELLYVEDVTFPLALIAAALGMGVAFVAGKDVDVAESLLFSSPRPHWRTVFLRVGSSVVPSCLVILVLGARGAGALDAPSSLLQNYGLVCYVFVGSLALAFSRWMGSLFGGGAALTTAVAVIALSSLVEGFPLQLLALPGTRAFESTSTYLLLLSMSLFLLVFWRLRQMGSRSLGSTAS
jgi:hypothetical protein